MSDRLEQLKKLAAADPADADVPYMIAQELIKAGDTEDSLAFFDACLVLDNNYHYARYHKARALDSIERTTEAADLLREAIPLAQSSGDAHAASELTALLDELT